MNNKQEFLNYADRNLGCRHNIGYSKELKLTNKDNLINFLVKDYVLHSPGLYQFMEGKSMDRLKIVML